MPEIAKHTVDLFGALTAPLVKTGSLNKSEHAAAMRCLTEAAQENPQTKPSEPRLLSRTEAAQRLGVCKATITRMVKKGELKGHYLRPGSNRSLRINSKSVDQLVEGGHKA